MLAPTELERIASVCAAIANEVADDSGFVSMRSLLARFQAHLLIQPMLVEGMLASIEQSNGGTNGGGRWAVLIDSETYRVNERDVESENGRRPLPNRLRNTIAHELVHSLAFRPSEFGVQLKAKPKSGETPDELVRAIERNTEQFSPLLLWSGKALHQLVARKKETLSVEQLLEARRNIGISRHVLINRLCLLRRTEASGLLACAGLRNLAIGLAEWGNDGRSVVRNWPLFANFDRKIMPAFLWKIAHQDRAPAETVFPDETFAMCGGPNSTIQLLADAGTEAHPNVKKLSIQISIEDAGRKPRGEFLFVVSVPASVQATR